MQIIPVLDLMGGSVVRGVMGDRARYRPIQSGLTASAEPLDVVRALADLGGFTTFYIADLDAIEGRGAHRRLIAGLAEAMPGIRFLIDAGVRTQGEALDILEQAFAGVVLGSETIADVATVEALSHEPRAILSLDYRGETFVGPAGLDDNAAAWPAGVIAMTLAKVGSGAGPDFARLAAVQALACDRAVYAAGGTRDIEDLRRLKAEGIAGVLVASALHDGRLGAAAIDEMSR